MTVLQKTMNGDCSVFHQIKHKVKNTLKIFVCYLFYYSGLFNLYVRFIRSRRFVSIFMYHHMKDDQDAFYSGISASMLRKQLSFLKRYFHVSSLGALVETLKSGNEVTENLAAITFDDGHEDFYLRAFSVLKEEKVPATVFLVAEAVEKQKPLWTERLAGIVKNTKLPFLEVGVNGAEKRYGLETLNAKLRSLENIKNYLKSLPDADRRQILNELEEECREALAVSERWMRVLSWEQIRQMQGSGIDFGAHTMTHPILTKLDRTVARAEIEASKKLIEERVGGCVSDFSYPNGEAGDFDREVQQMVKEAGFRSACTTILGTNDHRLDLYALKRIYVRNEPIPFFAARLCGLVS